MATNLIQTHTTTGTKATIDIPQNSIISYAVDVSTSITANVEVQLTEGGTFFVENTGITAGEVFVTTGPIHAIRINISAITGTATFEIGGVSR